MGAGSVSGDRVDAAVPPGPTLTPRVRAGARTPGRAIAGTPGRVRRRPVPAERAPARVHTGPRPPRCTRRCAKRTSRTQPGPAAHLELPVGRLQQLLRLVGRAARRQNELVDHNLVFELVHVHGHGATRRPGRRRAPSPHASTISEPAPANTNIYCAALTHRASPGSARGHAGRCSPAASARRLGAAGRTGARVRAPGLLRTSGVGRAPGPGPAALGALGLLRPALARRGLQTALAQTPAVGVFNQDPRTLV